MKIVTHSGIFHCDEVCAVALLELLENTQAEIIRTRDPAIIKADPLAYVIDVGRIYDHTSLLYDHHQETFHDTFDERHQVPLSSCGLIYRHYGERLFQLLYETYFVEDFH